MRRKYGDEEVDRKDQSAETHRGRDRRSSEPRLVCIINYESDQLRGHN